MSMSSLDFGGGGGGGWLRFIGGGSGPGPPGIGGKCLPGIIGGGNEFGFTPTSSLCAIHCLANDAQSTAQMEKIPVYMQITD